VLSMYLSKYDKWILKNLCLCPRAKENTFYLNDSLLKCFFAFRQETVKSRLSQITILPNLLMFYPCNLPSVCVFRVLGQIKSNMLTCCKYKFDKKICSHTQHANIVILLQFQHYFFEGRVFFCSWLYRQGFH